MIEYVFQHTRRQGRRLVKSRLFSGRYSLARGQRPVTVPLHTPDRAVAEKRLRDIVVEKQREAAGLIAPRAQREAAALPLSELLARYQADLASRHLAAGHVSDTIGRLRRLLDATGWKRLADVRPSDFIAWRSSFSGSAKTKKEYQTSANAFLNWLVRSDMIAANPLAKVDRVDIRGKSVRPTRSFTPEELRKLFAASAGRALFYQTLLYTGQRKKEVASLTWADLTLSGNTPQALIRDATTKDKKKRAVPLRPELASLLQAAKPSAAVDTDAVFLTVPTWEQLRADLRRAGIEQKDKLGRVVHFHAFRKTLQTLGVHAGINQRSAQALLGHSDPSLTANVYTDVAALDLHEEVAKLPWIDTQARTQNLCVSVRKSRIDAVLAELVKTVKSLVTNESSAENAPTRMAARHGFEP